MSKEAISESLHKHLSTEAESKLNVMHVFYLILACDVHSHHMRRRAQAVYLTLYNKFFQEVEMVRRFCSCIYVFALGMHGYTSVHRLKEHLARKLSMRLLNKAVVLLFV